MFIFSPARYYINPVVEVVPAIILRPPERILKLPLLLEAPARPDELVDVHYWIPYIVETKHSIEFLMNIMALIYYYSLPCVLAHEFPVAVADI